MDERDENQFFTFSEPDQGHGVVLWIGGHPEDPADTKAYLKTYPFRYIAEKSWKPLGLVSTSYARLAGLGPNKPKLLTVEGLKKASSTLARRILEGSPDVKFVFSFSRGASVLLNAYQDRSIFPRCDRIPPTIFISPKLGVNPNTTIEKALDIAILRRRIGLEGSWIHDYDKTFSDPGREDDPERDNELIDYLRRNSLWIIGELDNQHPVQPIRGLAKHLGFRVEVVCRARHDLSERPDFPLCQIYSHIIHTVIFFCIFSHIHSVSVL